MLILLLIILSSIMKIIIMQIIFPVDERGKDIKDMKSQHGKWSAYARSRQLFILSYFCSVKKRVVREINHQRGRN